MHAFCKMLWTFYWVKCQECNASRCYRKIFVSLPLPFFPYYTACNLKNQSISLSCILTLLPIVLAARNNFLLVTVVFVYALCYVRSATLKFCMPDIFICSISTFLSFLRMCNVVVLHSGTGEFCYFLIENFKNSN